MSSITDARFYYLPYLIPLMIVELIVIILIFRRCCKSEAEASQQGGVDQRIAMNHLAFDDDANAIVTPSMASPNSNINVSSSGSNSTLDEAYLGPNLINYIRFERTFSSYGKNTQRLLYVTRLLSFVYFFGISLVYDYIEHDGLGWHYFTTWNLLLITLYFGLAHFSSLVGLCYEVPIDGWSKSLKILAIVHHLLFEVAGASAMLVTTVAFSLLNPEFAFWNVTIHFVTVCSLLLEMFLNALPVRLDHCPFNIAWALLYLSFIWPIVVTGVVAEWPYDFLDTQDWKCFLWYTGLFLINISFYAVWWLFSVAKIRFRRHLAVRAQQHAESKDMLCDPFLAADPLDPSSTRHTELA